jgi:enoyl-CoA hydratase
VNHGFWVSKAMIEVDDLQSVSILRLRHGRANALDVELCRALLEFFEKAGRGPAKSVVMTAEGGIFSAGVDLLRILAGESPYVRQLLPALHEMCETVFSFPHPLVAAINGHAVAGGCILASMADYRIMAKGTGRIGVPELNVGVPFPPAPLEVMRFVLPSQHLSRVMIGGATYDADEGREFGLVDEVATSEDLLEQAIGAAHRLAAIHPATFSLTKAQLRAPFLERMRAGQSEVQQLVEEVWATPEAMQRIRAHVDRTIGAKKK